MVEIINHDSRFYSNIKRKRRNKKTKVCIAKGNSKTLLFS
jgi:hypothetical protein